jgi:hypothetical protein
VVLKYFLAFIKNKSQNQSKYGSEKKWRTSQGLEIQVKKVAKDPRGEKRGLLKNVKPAKLSF